MTYGLQVTNDTNNVQIDMTYQNLSLQSKQDFSLSANGITTISLANCIAPLMCINSTESVGFVGLAVSGSTYTWKIKASTTAATGTIYLFDKPNAAHTSTYGLKVLASDGTTEIFNSDNDYLRVDNILNVPFTAGFNAYGPTVSGPSASVTLPTAKYAVCMSQPRTLLGSTGPSTFYYILDGVKTTSTSVTVNQDVRIDFSAGGGGELPGMNITNSSGNFPALVVNVNGF